MKYRKQMHPDIRKAAVNIPYNKAIIKPANVFQTVSYALTRLPNGVERKKVRLQGYNGLAFQTEIFAPSNANGVLPCLIYVHGGAFSYKAAAYHKKLTCLYALGANCKVFFPDYHLTPKYPYPAAYQDVISLYTYITKQAKALGIDREKIGMAGDSAGACIAASVCNHSEKTGLRTPCLQMLVYPVTDIEMKTPSMQKYYDTPLWNSKNNKRMWQYYCGDLCSKKAYAASPMQNILPQTIPPTYIETAEYDCLHDEGLLYGNKLRQAGAQVEINETDGTVHGYDLFTSAAVVTQNIERRISFLQKHF